MTLSGDQYAALLAAEYHIRVIDALLRRDRIFIVYRAKRTLAATSIKQRR